MPKRLSALDASFLHLETSSVHMHVAGLAILDPSTRPDGTLTFEDLANLIHDRIHLVPRFRQKIVSIPFGIARPVWVDDDDFDIDFHLRRAALPAPGGARELADFVQRVHSRPLDRSKSLWEMYLIEGLEDGHVAILAKIHHAMIDGISGIDIATVLYDFTPEPRAVDRDLWSPEKEPSQRDLISHAILESVTDPLRTGVEAVREVVQAPAVVADQARRLGEGLVSLIRAGAPPSSPFNRRVGPNRRFAMVDAPVADFKLVKNALGGTVNDVVLATVGGALHRFMTRRALATAGVTLRAMVPVSTRDESQRMAMGNRVSNIFVDIPVGPMDPADRLRAIIKTTKDLKSSHQAIGAEALMSAGSWAPPTLHALAARMMNRARWMNLVVSNVPGPQVPMYLAGARLVVNYPMMPLAETVALSIAVTSLAGVMGFGLTGDWDALPDIDQLGESLRGALDDLKKAAAV
ncbi:MAG: wax ester/triacylglycerol synthase family O-acyltransferase [Actinomycetota bacterium]|nr:wax ester/triacylglycerol synthase family O-acyltransferase [Actinomycetota bacterium]